MGDRKLSPRALLLLRVVASKSMVDWATGKVERYYVPKHEVAYVQEPGVAEMTAVRVTGGGDSAAFKGLAARGFVKRPSGTTIDNPYVYVLTEDGHAFLEKLGEGKKKS